MRLFMLSSLLAPGMTGAVPPAGPLPVSGAMAARCAERDARPIAAASRPGAQTLGEQPPANAYLTVDRRVGGCRVPILVRTGIGRR